MGQPCDKEGGCGAAVMTHPLPLLPRGQRQLQQHLVVHLQHSIGGRERLVDEVSCRRFVDAHRFENRLLLHFLALWSVRRLQMETL